MSIISNAPYYDKYDSSKQYTQLLAVPGRVAQAREITEIQSTVKDIIKSLGDSFLADGNIIEGCQVIPDKDNKKVTVTEGKIYIKGLVLRLKESTIDIDAQGTEYIGIRLKESLVYASDDPDLKDPALGYENYNQPGMDRLKSELVLVKVTEIEESEYTAIISTLIDGELSVEQQTPTYSALTETLARRTYDESGSYIVEGLTVRVEADSADEDKFTVVVEPGKAYVHGYELTIPSARRVSLPRATVATPITARYIFATNSRYLLTTGPYVKSINRVECSLEYTEMVTINNSQGAVLRYNSAYRIIEVRKGSTVYSDTKYYLEPAGPGSPARIKWKDTDYPGDNVVVTYYYTYDEFQENVDYKLTLGPENNNYYLEWIDTSTYHPIVGKEIIINCDKYLARKDTVYIDQYGVIEAIQGTPADYGLEVAPTYPTYTLSLAAIMSPPGGVVDKSSSSLNIGVSNVGLTRFTMNDIHKLLNRVKTMEYDQTVLSLNTEAKDYATDDKRGIFTDPFIDLSKLSMDFNINASGEKIREDLPKFDVTIDIDSNMIHLPLVSSYIDMTYNTASSTVNKYNSTVTLKKSGERVVLSQMSATKSFLIAPYLSQPLTPEILITPSLDTWYDDTLIEVPVSISSNQVVSSSSRNVFSAQIDPSFHTNGLRVDSYAGSTTTYSAIGATTQTMISESVIRENMVEFIRRREILVEGTNYPPSLDNIKCYFDGVVAPLTAKGDTLPGTDEGSIKANSSGSFKASFTIPENINTGTRVVELKSNLQIEGYESSAYAFYKAIGIARTIQRTITTITTVLLHRTDLHLYDSYYVDPLAQTFVLDSNTILNGVDVYFESVPEANYPVTCEIREVSNGNITSTVYGTKTLRANNILVSADSSIPTRFTFDDPVLCESNKEYAFVLKSNSKDFRVYVAEIGETDILTNQIVTTNPYLQGVMMSSSNNSSWTSHQRADVKFRLISDTYEDASEVIFNNVNIEAGFCRFNLAAQSLIFEDTSIDWYYSTDNGSTYNYISPYNDRVVDKLDQNMKVKAKLSKTPGTLLSPILNLDSVSMSLACYDNSDSDGYYYISKLISGLDPYTTLEIILDTYNPSGTDMEIFMSPSANNADPYIMKELEEETSKSKELSNNWTERTYKVVLSEEVTQCRIFIKLKSTNKYHTPAFRRLRAIMS